ncbi:hypothetical protein L0665_06025 [Methanogenium marinum]|uniref:Uncharacterized protein n=1 Tax=Methanogenium marinum TaxID=348610 RepID=A0A9Q4KPZ3_9EURY|nr:hypothetical protein [Methanogenium marinum]MDE4908165.1 hypothetical protein [Methanogenium marinum]
MDCCVECESESPKNDMTFCPNLGYRQPVVTDFVRTPTIEPVELRSASTPLAQDVSSPEMEANTNGMVKILLAIGLSIVIIGIMMTVASIIFILVSWM